MTEDDARSWIGERFGPISSERLDAFGALLIAESGAQNLVAASTLDTIWTRHLVDSAQLLDHAPVNWQHWIDIGSGAGLPGLVIAILSGRAVTLVEPRRLRVEFLERCRAELGLAAVTIIQSKAENMAIDRAADVISARAVARTDALFLASRHLANRSTTYILPKGESADSEVVAARRLWHGVFHVKRSIVDPTSGIVIATGVSRR